MHAGAEFREVEIGVEFGIGDGGDDAFELEPLRREAVAKTFHAVIVQHAIDLCCQRFGIAELSLGGGVEQRLVRDAAPEEERQPRGEFEIVDLFGPVAGSGEIVKIKETRRRERGGGGGLHGLGERLAGSNAAQDMRGIAVEERLLDGAAKGAGEEGLQSPAHDGFDLFSLGRWIKEFLPNAAVAGIEVFAFDDGVAELKQGFQQQRGKRQMVGAIVEAVLGAEILGERRDSGEAPLVDELASCRTRD